MEGKGDTKYDKLAIWSIILSLFPLLFYGLISIFKFLNFIPILIPILGPIFPIVSLIFGISSLKRMKKYPDLLGRKLAWAGIILSVIQILLIIYLVLFTINELIKFTKQGGG